MKKILRKSVLKLTKAEELTLARYRAGEKPKDLYRAALYAALAKVRIANSPDPRIKFGVSSLSTAHGNERMKGTR